MRFFPKLRASYLYGRAMARFYKKRYEDAARILEKVCRLDPDHERKELYFSYLGRCYLALGHYNQALDLLSRAYQPFSERKATLQDSFERAEFQGYLRAFSDVLQKVGQLDRAREVAREAEEYVKTIKKATR